MDASNVKDQQVIVQIVLQKTQRNTINSQLQTNVHRIHAQFSLPNQRFIRVSSAQMENLEMELEVRLMSVKRHAKMDVQLASMQDWPSALLVRKVSLTPANSSSFNHNLAQLHARNHAQLDFTGTRRHSSAKNVMHYARLVSTQLQNVSVVTTLTESCFFWMSQTTYAFQLVRLALTWMWVQKNVWFVVTDVQSVMVQVWASVQNAQRTAQM